jgi:hypothetical protein
VCDATYAFRQEDALGRNAQPDEEPRCGAACYGCGEIPDECTCGACWQDEDDDFDRDELGDDPEED